MRLGWNDRDRVYVFDCTYDQREIAKAARFKWNAAAKRWQTEWAKTAQLLIEYADDETKKRLQDAGHRRQAADLKKNMIKKSEAERVGTPGLARNATEGSNF